MGKFLDITNLIDTVASAIATYKYTSVKEFSNATQGTDADTVLILLNSDNLDSNNSILGKINNGFNFEFWVIKNHQPEFTPLQIAAIQDDCNTIMNTFIFNMNQQSSEIFPITTWNARAVRNVTANLFAGWRFNLTIKTACNL
jgi:hypothetical protein